MDILDESIRKEFGNSSDFSVRELECNGVKLFCYAIDGLVSGAAVSEYVLKPLTEHLTGRNAMELYEQAQKGGIYNSVAVKCGSAMDAVNKLINGFCVVLFPNAGALAFETKSGEKRGISSPETESTVKGPRDAFTEMVRTNTSLIRRHLRTSELRIHETIVGEKSGTNVSVVWLEGTTSQELVQKMLDRIEEMEAEALLTPGMVEEFITGARATAFPMIQYTERPDSFCIGLLQGRVGVLIDGLPLGYLAPVDLKYLMESPEDLNRDYVTASCVRFLRYGALLTSLLLPGFYIALTLFHQQMIPLTLLRSMIEKKSNVPFSSSAEVLGLLVAFELLQESGVHLPQAIGQSVSTIGGIVVGTAAVEAGLISPSALIIVSIAGVSGFVLPNRDLAEAIRVWRFGIAILGSVAGLLGVTTGTICLCIHLAGLKSIGVPYLNPFNTPDGGRILRERMIRKRRKAKQ